MANSPMRLEGLDLARFFAFIGMVIVNFKIVVTDGVEGTGIQYSFAGLFEGRAAAMFVVLAGIGIGLAHERCKENTLATTIKRSAFLLIIGLLNSLIFDADILHYYAFYFIFGLLFINRTTSQIIWGIIVLNISFLGMLFTLNYDAGWSWNTFYYSDFWTPSGFIRNLFFNGWHPVFPWLSFFLFGIILARLNLSNRNTQNKMIIVGLITCVVVELLSITATQFSMDPELDLLLDTKPIPPVPLYILAGGSAACLGIGVCLRFASTLKQLNFLRLVSPAGRQTLTLYIAHIFIGMSVLDWLGMLGGQPISVALIAATIFCTAAAIYAFLWSKFFKRGPIEALMRRVTV